MRQNLRKSLRIRRRALARLEHPFEEAESVEVALRPIATDLELLPGRNPAATVSAHLSGASGKPDSDRVAKTETA